MAESPIIPSDAALLLENATLVDFALLTSAMHMAWLRHIGGRLKSDYRYSIGLVYNTFPPPPKEADLSKLEPLAQTVLDARAAHPGSTLADLYDPDTMPHWPGDTFHETAALRTPILAGRRVSSAGDEYDVVTTPPAEIYGSRNYGQGKKGSNFYYRMAASCRWPSRKACWTVLPPEPAGLGEYSVFTHGIPRRPFRALRCQRIENGKGSSASRTRRSAFIFGKMSGPRLAHPLRITADPELAHLQARRGARTQAVAMQGRGEKPLFRLAQLIGRDLRDVERAQSASPIQGRELAPQRHHPCLTEAAKSGRTPKE